MISRPKPKLVLRFMLRILVCVAAEMMSLVWVSRVTLPGDHQSPAALSAATLWTLLTQLGWEERERVWRKLWLLFVRGSGSGAATKRSSSGGENVSPIYQSVTLSTLLLKCSWKYFIKIYQGPLYKLSQPSFHGNCVVGGEIVSKQNSPHSKVETGWDGQQF